MFQYKVYILILGNLANKTNFRSYVSFHSNCAILFSMKQKYFIDSHKALTGLVVLLMIAIYNQWTNTTAWLYLALHGTYGILWVLKSNIFPDKSWEQEISWGYGLVNLVALSLYWISPWLIISQSVHVPAWYLGMCVSLYIFGIFFHFTTDMQKYIALKLQPAHLITTGMATHCRNMNYFGELFLLHYATQNSMLN
ncbi:MAG: hypothetical protein B6242_07505 [Anaerolineaceae bacterium 4572_78]|nr:MAG: hypothetical protein B6242_07505 [Anaerolineaceae bacterium 4572_78]